MAIALWFGRETSGDEHRSACHPSGGVSIPAENPKAFAASVTEAELDAERTLIERFRAGDELAFTNIFRAHYPLVVYGLTRYGVTIDIAEDIAQDVFTQLWERRHEIDPNRPIRGYLLTAGRNRVLNVLAHDAVVRHHVEHTVAQHAQSVGMPTSPAADEAMLLDELTQTVAERVAHLSPRQREIYHLSREQGLSANEIGRMLGISAQTVYVQLGRVVRALYPALAPWIEGRR